MKNNTKKKGSPAKKLIPAAGALMISACMLATSTYAWFTMNKEVQVSGLEMKTHVGSNLLICSDNVEANYSSSRLVQGRKALLEPVSSVSGLTGSFFYTTDAAADGHKITTPTVSGETVTNGYTPYSESQTQQDITAGKAGYDSAFQSAYETGAATATDFDTAYGYVDYTFYLKATSDAENQEVRLTKCDLDYTDKDSTKGAATDAAWRIAVFSKELTADQSGAGLTGTNGTGSLDPAGSGETAKSILRLSGATNFTQVSSKEQAVSGAGTRGDVTYDGSAVLGTITTAGTTKYYKVTVRVWLEGEDTTCKSSTYADLQDGKWSLDLDINLVASSDTTYTAVTHITSNTWDATKTPTQDSVTTVPN